MSLHYTNGTSDDALGVYVDQAATKVGARFDSQGRRRVGTTAAPTVASGAGAGTSPTVTVVAGSTDEHGVIQVAAGASTVAGILATVTFNQAYAVAPIAVLAAQDVNSAAAGLYATTTTTTLVIKSTSAVTASATTKVSYVAVGGA